ncbi:hypothetical protein Hypma_008124 [Hypsizygus marmoreus]|uniref:Uncharacterized protein n=1 Tax=Hypsizygus marmoreus TaxID=39966 RepID=A0A369JUG5_HYPMA|nr:hypothetical protein Hypma_008124 [Hypsizygus marmoreus]
MSSQFSGVALPMNIEVTGKMTDVLKELTFTFCPASGMEVRISDLTRPYLIDSRLGERVDNTSLMEDAKEDFASEDQDASFLIQTNTRLRSESPSMSRNEVEISESTSSSPIDSEVREHIKSIVPMKDTTMDFLSENHVNNLRPSSSIRCCSGESSRVIDTVILTNESLPSSMSGPDQNQAGSKSKPIDVDAVSASSVTTLSVTTSDQWEALASMIDKMHHIVEDLKKKEQAQNAPPGSPLSETVHEDLDTYSPLLIIDSLEDFEHVHNMQIKDLFRAMDTSYTLQINQINKAIQSTHATNAIYA